MTLSHGDLALMANLSRYPVGESLRGLERDGLISSGYRSINVIDGAAWRAMINAD